MARGTESSDFCTGCDVKKTDGALHVSHVQAPGSEKCLPVCLYTCVPAALGRACTGPATCWFSPFNALPCIHPEIASRQPLARLFSFVGGIRVHIGVTVVHGSPCSSLLQIVSQFGWSLFQAKAWWPIQSAH